MEKSASNEEQGIESEFVSTIRYIDLYLQQKSDLFLQHYVLEPMDLLLRQIMGLSVIVTLLAAGTISLVMGTTLFISTIVPLWAALLITGAIIFGLGATIAYIIFSNKIVLKIPIDSGIVQNGTT